MSIVIMSSSASLTQCVFACVWVSSLFVVFPRVTLSHQHACHCHSDCAVTYARFLAPWLTGRLLWWNLKDVGTNHTSSSSFLWVTAGLSLTSSSRVLFIFLLICFLKRWLWFFFSLHVGCKLLVVPHCDPEAMLFCAKQESDLFYLKQHWSSPLTSNDLFTTDFTLNQVLHSKTHLLHNKRADLSLLMRQQGKEAKWEYRHME